MKLISIRLLENSNGLALTKWTFSNGVTAKVNMLTDYFARLHPLLGMEFETCAIGIATGNNIVAYRDRGCKYILNTSWYLRIGLENLPEPIGVLS